MKENKLLESLSLAKRKVDGESYAERIFDLSVDQLRGEMQSMLAVDPHAERVYCRYRSTVLECRTNLGHEDGERVALILLLIQSTRLRDAERRVPPENWNLP